MDIDIKYRLDILTKLSLLQTAIRQCEENIKTLEKNSTLIQKNIQLEALEKIRKELEETIAQKNRMIGKIIEKIEAEKEKIEKYLTEKITKETSVLQIISGDGDEIVDWKRKYGKETEQKTFVQFLRNYESRRKANENIQKASESKMVDVMIQYKTEHDFGAAPSLQGFAEFALVYDRLKTSELLSYEEKVQNARRAAEEEFREQFYLNYRKT